MLSSSVHGPIDAPVPVPVCLLSARVCPTSVCTNCLPVCGVCVCVCVCVCVLWCGIPPFFHIPWLAPNLLAPPCPNLKLLGSDYETHTHTHTRTHTHTHTLDRKFDALSAVEASNCFLSKGAPATTVAGAGWWVVLHAVSQFGYPIPYGGSIIGASGLPSDTYSVDTIDRGDGTYNATVYARRAGTYPIHLTVNGHVIGGHAVNVSVTAASLSPGDSLLSGAPVSHGFASVAGHALHMSLQVRDKGVRGVGYVCAGWEGLRDDEAIQNVASPRGTRSPEMLVAPPGRQARDKYGNNVTETTVAGPSVVMTAGPPTGNLTFDVSRQGTGGGLFDIAFEPIIAGDYSISGPSMWVCLPCFSVPMPMPFRAIVGGGLMTRDPRPSSVRANSTPCVQSRWRANTSMGLRLASRFIRCPMRTRSTRW